MTTHREGAPEVETSHQTIKSEVIPFDPWSHCATWTPSLFGMTNPPAYEAARVGNQKGLSTVVWLYRFFDASMAPLYFGITINPSYRWTEHMCHEWWSQVRFASIEGVPPKDRYAHESKAIWAEQPIHNMTQRTRPICTTVYFDQQPDRVVAQFRDRMLAEDFTALVAAFHSIDPRDPA